MNPALRIPLLPVQSSNIKAVGYDDGKGILAVEFASGDIFHYAGVHADLALALYQAESVGKYYASTIRGKFDGDKMTGPCGACGAKGWIEDLCSCGAGSFLRQEYIPNERKGKGSTASDGDPRELHGDGGAGQRHTGAGRSGRDSDSRQSPRGGGVPTGADSARAGGRAATATRAGASSRKRSSRD